MFAAAAKRCWPHSWQLWLLLETPNESLFIPLCRPRDTVVDRSRLTERLTVSDDRHLTLICAPASFGKTTLLSQWITTSDRCMCWVSLDDGDNDSIRLWSYFIAALQGLKPKLGTNVLELLQRLQHCGRNPRKI